MKRSGITKLSSVYVNCIGHTDCKVRWKIFHASKAQIQELHGVSIGTDVSLIFFQNDGTAHGHEESAGNIRWMKSRNLQDLLQEDKVEQEKEYKAKTLRPRLKM